VIWVGCCRIDLKKNLIWNVCCSPFFLDSHSVETAAVLVGRLAWICPRVLIESKFKLSEILKPFTISLRNLGDGNEKAQALKGMLLHSLC
jgi:hypothetical protein